MDLTAILKSAILGVVQGLTEFLPISSSGHLIAAKEILESEASLAFDVALHVATLAAVVSYFWRDLLELAVHPRRFPLLALLALATIPGATLGLLLGDWRETISPWYAVYGWFFSASYLLSSRGKGGNAHFTELGPLRALGIGLAQSLAIFPGVSRSGSSIVCGLYLGLKRESAARFSFILSIPLILGAGLKSSMDLNAKTIADAGGLLAISFGMVLAFLVGLGALHLLFRIVRSEKFSLFGWYNLLAAISFGAYLFLRA